MGFGVPHPFSLCKSFVNPPGRAALSPLFPVGYDDYFSSFPVDYAPRPRYNNDMNTNESTKELAASLLFFGILVAITFLV